MRVDSGAAVARDMERLFSGMARPPLRQPADAATRGLARQPASGRKSWVFVAVAIACLAFLLFFWRTEPKPALTPANPATPIPAETTASVETIVPRPVMPAPIGAPHTPAARKAVTPTETASVKTNTPAPVAAKTRTKPAASVAEETRTATKASTTRTAAKAPPAERPSPARALCRDASDRATCFYHAVLDADRGLRRAYDRAADAHVPLSELYRARAAWKAALSRSRRQPLMAIGALDRLAAELSAKASTIDASAK